MSRYKKKNNGLKIVLSIILIALIIVAGIVTAEKIENNKIQKELEQSEVSNIPEKKEDNTTIENIVENETGKEDEKKEEPEQPNQPVSTDIFGKYYAQAENILNKMTLEEKVGQMFLARYPESGVIEEIKTHSPGGYILFSRDFDNQTKESIKTQLQQCQDASKIKMCMGVDEEGGTVVRVSNHKAFRNTKFLSPQQIWAKGQLPLILQDSKEKSELLKSIGLNMNLTPVADVPSSSTDFIYARSYGRGAEKTAIYVSELIKTMNESGMISTMKHFPGYGNNVDTHTGIAIDERPYSTFEKTDFLPFKSGIGANGPTILVSHNIVKCMDGNKPASLSENIHKILREDLGFSGIIMTDDLAMDAVKSYVENGEAAVQAVIAGNDMIISSDFAKQKEQVVNAVRSGNISEETINTAVRRILAFKYSYQIIK